MKLWRKEDEDLGITCIINYKGQPIQSIKTAWKGDVKKGLEYRAVFGYMSCDTLLPLKLLRQAQTLRRYPTSWGTPPPP